MMTLKQGILPNVTIEHNFQLPMKKFINYLLIDRTCFSGTFVKLFQVAEISHARNKNELITFACLAELLSAAACLFLTLLLNGFLLNILVNEDLFVNL